MSSDSTVEGGSVVGEASGDVSIVPGIIGNALYVSGSSATNVLLGERRDSCFWSPALCTNGYTMALWMKIGMKTGTELYYISNGGQASVSYGVSINLASGPSLRWAVKTHDSWWLVNCPITKNEWHHVSFAWKSDTGIKAFLNGDECNDDTTATSNTRETSSYNDFYMGKPNNAATQKGGEATYDELLFWPEYKDENFISALYDMYQQSTGKLSIRLLEVQKLEQITFKIKVFKMFNYLIISSWSQKFSSNESNATRTHRHKAHSCSWSAKGGIISSRMLQVVFCGRRILSTCQLECC